VDEYCQLFENLFAEVRSYEAFKLLHLGMVSEVKRKSLPAIAKAVGLDNQQTYTTFNRVSLAGTTATLKAVGINSQGVARSVTNFTD